MSLNSTKNKMETTYSSLVAKRNDPSKSYYMISELIDNSISSWIQINSDETLNILIEIDNDNKFIRVTDNAQGMSFETLENSVRLNKENTGNNLNMFGVGMKNAAFWFGKDLEIFSKQKDCVAYKTEIITSTIKDLNETVEWEVTKDNEFNLIKGTIVKISNIYDSRLIKSAELGIIKTPNVDIMDVLTMKYYNYIKDNKVIIDIKYTNEKTIIKSKVEPVNRETQNIPIIKKEKLIKQFDTVVKSKKIIFRYLTDLREKVIDAVDNEKPLEFEFDINFENNIDNPKNEKLHFVFGIQIQNAIGSDDRKYFKKRYGLTTYQKDRAINMPGINVVPLGEYTRTNIKRVYGFVELGNHFKPDNNKQDFIFGNLEEKFKEMIKIIGSEIIVLADAVYNTIGTESKVSAKNNDNSSVKIQNEINAKSNNLVWEINPKGAVITPIEDSEIKININQIATDDVNSRDYFISTEASFQNEKHFNISFNINHPIWKPLTTSALIDTKTVLYPLISIIGLTTLQNNYAILKNILGTTEAMQTNYLDIIKKISDYTITVDLVEE